MGVHPFHCLCISEQPIDYHWYRQNPDGTWSHKLGETPVTNLDASGNLITNPETADKSYSTKQYTDFIGFYCISPLNNLYSSTASAHTGAETIDINLSKNSVSHLNSSDVATIVPEMTYEDVIAEIGVPHRYLESRVIVAEYDLVDGSVFVVKYADSGDQLSVASCHIERSSLYEENN